MKTNKAGGPKKARKDGPFPMKDCPFPLWTRLAVATSYGKDVPFPLTGTALYWERVPFETVYQGNNGPKTSKIGVLRSELDLTSRFPELDLRDVDFNKEEVIFVALGGRPNNGLRFR